MFSNVSDRSQEQPRPAIHTCGLRGCRYLLLALVLSLASQALQAQDSRPASQPASRPVIRFPTPEAAVSAYVKASQKGDEEGMSATYAPPFDLMGRATARFRRAHAALIEEVKGRFGDDGVAAVDDQRYHLPPFGVIESHRTLSEEVNADVARLKVEFLVQGREKPQEMLLEVRNFDGEWRLTMFNGRPLAVVDGHDKYILEWEVAEEATRRTLKTLQTAKIKSAADVATLRQELMKTITMDRMALRKLREPPSPPDSRPNPHRRRPH